MFAAMRASVLPFSLMNFGQRFWLCPDWVWCGLSLWGLDLSPLQHFPPLQVFLGSGGRFSSEFIKKLLPSSLYPHDRAAASLSLFQMAGMSSLTALLGTVYSFSCSLDGQPRTQVTKAAWGWQPALTFYCDSSKATLSVLPGKQSLCPVNCTGDYVTIDPESQLPSEA